MNHIGVKGGALMSALVSGALAAGAISAAPAANATCASFFGIGNSVNCKSNLTSIAIAIGPNAQALALGYFGAAFSVGTDALAFSPGAFAFATAVGDNSGAVAGGVFSIATTLGANGVASAGGQGLNIALNVTPATAVDGGSKVGAIGFGNIGVNFLGNGTTFEGHQVLATGVLNTAANIGGTDDIVWAGGGSGVLNTAFNTLGSGNFVAAGPGPVAIAGSILQNGEAVTKVGPGFAINGFKVGGAAAVAPKKTAAPTATASRGSKTNAPTAAGRGSAKKATASAAAAGHRSGKR